VYTAISNGVSSDSSQSLDVSLRIVTNALASTSQVSVSISSQKLASTDFVMVNMPRVVFMSSCHYTGGRSWNGGWSICWSKESISVSILLLQLQSVNAAAAAINALLIAHFDQTVASQLRDRGVTFVNE